MIGSGAGSGPLLRSAPPHVAELAGQVLAEVAPLTERLVEAILREDPSYDQRRTSREDLARSCHDNLVRILQGLRDGSPAGEAVFDAPRATGHRRAEQGMPLESVLHAYRLGHRSIWDALVAKARSEGGVDGLVEAASYVWEMVDAFSSVVAGSYRDTEMLITRRDDQRRDALVDALLEGRGRERAVAAEAAAALDLPERDPFVVVVLAGTLVGTAAADSLAVRGIRAAWRTRADREIGLVALPDGGTAELCRVLDAVPALRGGMSPAVPCLAEVDVAHRHAETALRALPAAHGGIGGLDARLAAALLVTAPDLADRLVGRALGGLLDLDAVERDVLLQTLATWLDTGGSAGQTAARLYCHRNTVLNRLRRIEALTARSLDRVDHLVEWSLALLARQVLPAAPTAGAVPAAATTQASTEAVTVAVAATAASGAPAVPVDRVRSGTMGA